MTKNKKLPKKQFLVNVAYAIGLEAILIAIITLFSLLLINAGLASGSKMMTIVTIILTLVLSLIIIYGLVYLNHQFCHMPALYYIVVGLATSVIILWIRIYFSTLEVQICNEVTGCLQAIKNSQFATMMFVFSVAYYLIYLLTNHFYEKQLKK